MRSYWPGGPYSTLNPCPANWGKITFSYNYSNNNSIAQDVSDLLKVGESLNKEEEYDIEDPETEKER